KAFMKADEKLRARIWRDLYQKIGKLFHRYGKEEPTGKGDYWVVDDDYGWRQHTVYVNTLKLLSPVIIAALRSYLRYLPNWQIVLVVNVLGEGKTWPPMGVIIRRKEIIDGLRREYLPMPYRKLVIPGSKPGTGYD